MGAVYLTASYMDGRSKDPIRSELMNQKAHGGNVCQSIQCTDLMEVDVCDADTVYVTLGFCKDIVDGENITAHLFGDIQMGKTMGNGLKGVVAVVVTVIVAMAMIMLMAVVMVVTVTMIVTMVMAVIAVLGMTVTVRSSVEAFVFLQTIYLYRKMSAEDATLGGGLRNIADRGQTDAVELFQKGFLVREKLIEAGAEHITCGAHGAVKIEGSHFLPSMWLIMAAK